MSEPASPPGLEAVRAALEAPEPVTLPPELQGAASAVAGDPSSDDGDPGPAPDDDGREPAPSASGGTPVDPEALADCAGYPLNDYGNGLRFVRHFGEDILFVARIGWHAWDGTRWLHDKDIAQGVSPRMRCLAHRMGAMIAQEVEHLAPTPRERVLLDRERGLLRRRSELERLPADQLTDAVADELAGIEGQLRTLEATLKAHKTRVGRHLTHAKNIGNSGPIDHMLGEARAMRLVDHEAMDAEALDVNCLSGVIRFTVEAEVPDPVADVRLVPHERCQRHTKVMPVAWDPQARAPVFEAFLQRVQPDLEMRQFLARWLGLGMTGLTGEHKLAYFHGSGRNGKSVLIDIVARILGDYSTPARIETLTGSGRKAGSDATPDLIPLIGARLVRASEPDEGTKWQEGLIKELTGGEPLLVRPNYGEFIELHPKFKLTISGNHKPQIIGTDEGIWSRLMLVPFDVTIPEAERDQALPDKLWDERAGILQWLVDGLIDYLQGGLRPPQAVSAATAAFREESDPIGRFLSEACVVSGQREDSVAATDLRDAFQFWQTQQALAVWTDGTVSRRLGGAEQRWVSPEGRRFVRRESCGAKYYDGIRLTDAFRRAIEAAPRNKDGKPVWSSHAAGTF